MWIGLTTKPIKKRYGQGVSSGFEGRSAVQWLITALEINGEILHQKRGNWGRYMDSKCWMLDTLFH